MVSRNIKPKLKNPDFHNITTVENNTIKRSGTDKAVLLVASKILFLAFGYYYLFFTFIKISNGKALLSLVGFEFLD